MMRRDTLARQPVRVTRILSMALLPLIVATLSLSVLADEFQRPEIDRSTLPTEVCWKSDDAWYTALIEARKFDELEAHAAELRRTRAKYRDGRSQLFRLYVKLAEAGIPDDDEAEQWYKRRITLLEAWMAAKPDSITPRETLARLYHSYGFLARGSGYADSVTEEGQELFAKRCQKGLALLDEAARRSDVRDVGYYRFRIDLARGSEELPDRELVYAALKLDPRDIEATYGMAQNLLPRWFGDSGELEQFADDVAQRTEAETGQLQYLKVFRLAADFEEKNVFEVHDFDWERVRQGMADRDRLYPKAKEDHDWIAYYAALAGDLKTAAKYASDLGENPDYSDWGGQKLFNGWKFRLEPDGPTGDQKLVIAPDLCRSQAVQVSPDGQAVLTCSEFREARLFDLSEGRKLLEFPIDQVHPRTPSVAWNRQELLAMNDEESGLYVMSLVDGSEKTLKSVTGKPSRIALTPDESLAVIQLESQLELLEMESGKLRRTIPAPRKNAFGSLSISPQGDRLAITSEQNRMVIYDLKSGLELTSWPTGKDRIEGLAWHPTGKRLATGDHAGHVRIWSVDEQRKLFEMVSPLPAVRSVAFSPDGQRLVIGAGTTKVEQLLDQPPVMLWEYETSQPLQPLKGHRLGVWLVQFSSPDTLVSAGFDWTVRTWDVRQ